ncbi:MAG: hypothetical protein Kow00129_16900 [Thermoleophilia bacterium]
MTPVPDTQENEAKCICADCPTYPGEGGLFCAKGASLAEINRRGCICGDCAVYQQNGLTGGYYCAEGAA